MSRPQRGSGREPSMKNGLCVVLSVVALAAIAGHPRALAIDRGDVESPRASARLERTSLAPGRPQTVAAPATRSSAATDPSDAALVGKYCLTCHSDRLKTGDLTLEGMNYENIP